MAQAVSWETLIPFKLSLNFLDREPRNAKKLNSIPLMAVDMIISSTPNCPQRSGEASFERMSVFSSISTILDRAISPHPRPTVAIIWWALENSIEFVEGASHLECCKGWGLRHSMLTDLLIDVASNQREAELRRPPPRRRPPGGTTRARCEGAMNDAMASVNPGQDAIGAIQETTAKPVSGVSLEVSCEI